MAKINISMPDELLDEIDSLAAELNESRSALIREASTRYVTQALSERASRERRASIDAGVASARTLGARMKPFDVEAAVRHERDRDGR